MVPTMLPKYVTSHHSELLPLPQNHRDSSEYRDRDGRAGTVSKCPQQRCRIAARARDQH